MKWLIGSVIVVLSFYNAHAQNTGPLNSGPGIGGPATRWMRRRPYPQIIEKLVPEEMKQKITEISNNHELTWEERQKQVDTLLDNIPPEELAKMPLPPGLESLPAGVYDQIEQIHEDKTLKWSERRQRIRQLLRSLPHEQRQTALKNILFPSMPPPGFKAVISPTVYQQLVSVHQNSDLSVREKKQRIDKIMLQVPADQLAKLPLPPLMRALPVATQQRLRSIIRDYRTPWDERHEKVKEFVESLPIEERRLMRPPLPAFVKDLPTEAQTRLQAIHDDDNLELQERFRRFREVIDSLPEEVKAKIEHES